MQEVDSQIINGRAELADPVKALFERPPVVPGAPVVHDIDEVGERNALFPSARVGRGAIDRLGLRQPRRGQSRAQIVEVSVSCVGFKCLHVAGWTGHEYLLVIVEPAKIYREPAKTVLACLHASVQPAKVVPCVPGSLTFASVTC